ncbi:MAG TPA: hypothetical protein VF017_04980 [Thermoanaerobaculia bacterium]|nr:hypothetical protein [Thermoanaerobaculia bacterium]
MGKPNVDVILKRFESPDEVRVMERGKFEIVRLGGVTIGRATYEPGWKWSEHVGPGVGNEPYVSLRFLGVDHSSQ